ncbi:META domain-containing protein [Frigidibacter sp. RF13]|uniref:META domain-containing protein n=1 Tax=Frigidibacter sp. RF13 TaxID=2997340 RepID=UPI00227132C5|nr:META domain-containing protein [Frigidibacter sp. RF13]MCY1128248.1 META domain-containing protein [Frigidibacter sp. RF13]
MHRVSRLAPALPLGVALVLAGSIPSASARSAAPCAKIAPTLDSGASISVGRFTDRGWVPVELAGAPVPEGTEISLTIDFHGKVDGHTGCNRITGVAEMDAGLLVLGPLAITRMTCTEPRMALEKAYLDALSEVVSFAVGLDDNLYLSRADGSVALCLRPCR